MLTDAVIVVAWRDRGDRHRQANLRHVLAYLDGLGIAPVMVSSDGRERELPFNRSRAYNRAVAALPASVRVLVFHEADMIVPEHQLRLGIAKAREQDGLVVPFDTYHYLSPASTHAVLAGANPHACVPERSMLDGRSVGAVNIVSRDTLRLAGRWDESFEGWGWDDRAMCRAFRIATGEPTRLVPGAGIHLWHKPGWSDQDRFAGGTHDLSPIEAAATAANKNRFRLYEKARTLNQVRALTAGGVI